MRFLTLMGTGAELLLSLCELGAFFSLKLLCYYFPDFGWFPIIHTLISIQLKTRGTVQMLESFFCATLSSRVLCPVNPGCLGFSRCQGLSLQLRSCCAMGWNPSGQKAGSVKEFTCFVSFLSRITALMLPTDIWKLFFLHFVWFSKQYLQARV